MRSSSSSSSSSAAAASSQHQLHHQSAAAVPASKQVIPAEQWQKDLSDVRIQREELNNLIMNYLVIEGFQSTAQAFQEEAQVGLGLDLTTIGDRMEIRTAVQNGEVSAAIERVNDLNPEILDGNPTLCFHLQQQQLIELIRQGKTRQALQFAQEELGPRSEDEPSLLEELERTMTLLVFGSQNAPQLPSSISALLDANHRQSTASELNAAILGSMNQEKEPTLPILLRLAIWAEQELQQTTSFPTLNWDTGEFGLSPGASASSVLSGAALSSFPPRPASTAAAATAQEPSQRAVVPMQP